MAFNKNKARKFLIAYQYTNNRYGGFGNKIIISKSGKITEEDLPAVHQEINNALEPQVGTAGIVILNIMDLGPVTNDDSEKIESQEVENE